MDVFYLPSDPVQMPTAGAQLALQASFWDNWSPFSLCSLQPAVPAEHLVGLRAAVCGQSHQSDGPLETLPRLNHLPLPETEANH